MNCFKIRCPKIMNLKLYLDKEMIAPVFKSFLIRMEQLGDHLAQNNQATYLKRLGRVS